MLLECLGIGLQNSVRNWFHRSGILSLGRTSPSSQSPMSLTHWAALSPLISVRVKATFLNGELYPTMSAFRHRYAFTSLMKSSALVLSSLWRSSCTTEKKPWPNPTQLEKTRKSVAVATNWCTVAVVVEVLSFSTSTTCNWSQPVAHQQPVNNST